MAISKVETLVQPSDVGRRGVRSWNHLHAERSSRGARSLLNRANARTYLPASRSSAPPRRWPGMRVPVADSRDLAGMDASRGRQVDLRHGAKDRHDVFGPRINFSIPVRGQDLPRIVTRRAWTSSSRFVRDASEDDRAPSEEASSFAPAASTVRGQALRLGMEWVARHDIAITLHDDRPGGPSAGSVLMSHSTPGADVRPASGRASSGVELEGTTR